MDASIDLTTDQLRCLNALIDTLIPPDDWPGGVDAGVVGYLVRLLRDQRELLPIYESGLDLLDLEAHAYRAWTDFHELDPSERTELLVNLEKGVTSREWPFSPSWFLSTAVNHAAEGFYSDPGNGGNRDGVAWKMIGFEVRG